MLGVMDRTSDAAGSRTAAFFDLDKTVIASSSMLAFSRQFYNAGLLCRTDVLRSAYARGIYLLSGADHTRMERLRTELSALVTGWHVQTVRDIVAESLQRVVEPLIYGEARELIAWHRDQGHDIVLVSSAGADVAEPVGRFLGFDQVISTRMLVEDGCYTGEIEFYAYADQKVTAIEELAAERGYDLDEAYGYSDSITDLPLLQAVGRPTVVNPDRALRRIAAEQDWPVLEFRRDKGIGNGPLLKEMVRASRSGASLAVAGVVIAGLVWAGRRRARKQG
jgi:HAD superfamily hydrolase (TIGR01490 family)